MTRKNVVGVMTVVAVCAATFGNVNGAFAYKSGSGELHGGRLAVGIESESRARRATGIR